MKLLFTTDEKYSTILKNAWNSDLLWKKLRYNPANWGTLINEGQNYGTIPKIYETSIYYRKSYSIILKQSNL